MQNLTITISTQSAELASPSKLSNAFKFNGHPVRIITIDGEPWFAVADVCDVLGYVNSRDALAKHCRAEGVVKRDTPMESDVAKRDTTSTARKNQTLTFINEGNLYRLIIKSRKPEAEKFESWVCDEVLPSIRKTGSYTTSPMPPAPITINASQYRELDRMVDIIAGSLVATPTARTIIWNAVRFETNIENINKLPVSKFEQAKAILKRMHETTYQNFRPWLSMIELEFLTQYLCQGMQPTSELKKRWRKAYTVGLPQPINWKEIALQLESDSV